MRLRTTMATLLLTALLGAGAHAATLTHLTGVNSETSEWFEADGTWALTLAATCYEGFGYVEATVFNENAEQVGVVTVMGEGIERGVFEAAPGRYYIEVYTSYWHVYNWELLVEEGTGGDYAVGSPLLTVSHADHEQAQADAAEVLASEDSGPIDIWDGIFTPEQARRGLTAFETNCAVCHGSDLVSADGYAPDLTGFMFTSRWYGVSVADRFERILTTMPLGNPGSLDDGDVVDILAHIFNVNKFPAGDAELEPGPHLERIVIGPKD
jgi:S-disulfanyl-L-cysteine oxidoreductase SoxD